MNTFNEDFELTLFDRLEMIRAVLQNVTPDECYISFSGGKDSTVLSHLIDEAIPHNEYHRVFDDTGIEYQAIRDFVYDLQKTDSRIEIIKPNKNIREMLKEDGYPFKSKFHSEMVASYQRCTSQDKPITKTVQTYIDRTSTHSDRNCPKCLLYQFQPDFDLKISKKCCTRLKKEPFRKYEKETGRMLRITGLRAAEGGVRNFHFAAGGGCVFKDKEGDIYQFSPLAPVSDEFIEWYIQTRNIKLAELYYPPFNFRRTGCCSCPYSLDIGKQLEISKELLPSEFKRAWLIWKPVFEEYKRIGYRKMKDIPNPFDNPPQNKKSQEDETK